MRARVALVIVLALMSTHLLGASGASASVTYEVWVGRFVKPTSASWESMRFFPGAIRIHQGDVLHFNSTGFHSVTLLPVGTDPDQWVDEHAGGVDRDYSLFVADRDAEVPTLKANLSILPPSSDCGWGAQPACSFSGYDGETLHSGVPLFDEGQGYEAKNFSFSAQIDSDPGDTVWAVDPLAPGMKMSIAVVAAEEDASDQSDINTARNSRVAGDLTAAKKLHAEYATKNVTTTVKGKKYRSVWAGVETSTLALRSMYPKKVTIKKRQGVKWLFSKNVFSIHSIGLPLGKFASKAAGFPLIACDADGDSTQPGSGEPDTAPTSASFPYCDAWEYLELELPVGIATRSGNGVYMAGNDSEGSGLKGARVDAPKSFSVLFTKASPKAGFPYLSAFDRIGGFAMKGTVVVKASG